jgi:hypothetical protein
LPIHLSAALTVRHWLGRRNDNPGIPCRRAIDVQHWSSRASENFDVLARNLTFGVSSNQAAEKLLVVTTSNVLIADTGV